MDTRRFARRVPRRRRRLVLIHSSAGVPIPSWLGWLERRFNSPSPQKIPASRDMKPRGNTCDVRPESGPSKLDTVGGGGETCLMMWIIIIQIRGEREETERRERVFFYPPQNPSLSLTVGLVKETGHMCFWLKPEALPTFSRMMKIKCGKSFLRSHVLQNWLDVHKQ